MNPGYFSDVKTKAMQAEGLLEAACCFIGDQKRGSLCLELIQTAQEICGEINEALDTVNLPKDGA